MSFDSHPDLFVTYYGHNSLYRNLGNGKFQDVTERAGLPVTGTRWGSGCALIDYDRDGLLDIFVANYVDFDPAHVPKPGSAKTCEWKGLAGLVQAARSSRPGTTRSIHNNGDGTFTDVSAKRPHSARRAHVSA